jgi:glyoxylase-like metal-dependent hydrolase (beta-lactamase superfamily II)
MLAASLARAGLRGPNDVTAVLLTHRHSDHAGNAAWLRQRFACPVICHPADAPFLRGEATPPALRRGVGNLYEELMCGIEDRWPSHCAIDDVFAEGPWNWGFHIFPVPGHTEGSAMLWHEPTRTLFSGDAIIAGLPPQRWIEGMYLAVPAFSLDVEGCRDAVKRVLRDLPPTDALCSGHGPPITRDTTAKLARLRLSVA